MEHEVLKYKIPYNSLNDTLEALTIQAMLSVNYCAQKWGTNNSLSRIFTIVKQNTTYVNDPRDVELIQSVPTLIENNYHGIPGAGDCDCFSVFLIALLIANGFQPNQIFIVLQGRTIKTPSHIFIECENKYLDATENHYNTMRNYPYIQKIKLSKFVVIR